MSVLKNKRKECKAEYVNETYKAYVQTVEFVSKMSARYSRLIGSDIIHTAYEAMRCAESANSIFPGTESQMHMREEYLVNARAYLKSLDVALSVCYDILMKNPQGAFTTSSGKDVQARDAVRKLDNMAQSLGESIDNGIRMISGVIKSDKDKLRKQKKQSDTASDE